MNRLFTQTDFLYEILITLDILIYSNNINNYSNYTVLQLVHIELFKQIPRKLLLLKRAALLNVASIKDFEIHVTSQ